MNNNVIKLDNVILVARLFHYNYLVCTNNCIHTIYSNTDKDLTSDGGQRSRDKAGAVLLTSETKWWSVKPAS